ncbi:MAG: ATP-dependent deoxyribonuclease subunit [Phycisphaerales bacterium]|nr:ATP-dependent deoxyribonuclease subunit [Phycisphaerales bacterium]
MSVTFVIGRSGSGKTFRCFQSIVAELRARPLGPRIYWLLPRQATFTAERELTCASGLPGFCRARVVSFEQLGEDIFTECGGAAVPEITPLGRQMILGHLLRRHAGQLTFFKSVARQPGLAAELDLTFAEMERAGKTAGDLAALLDDLSQSGPVDADALSLQSKIRDLHLLYDAYTRYLGQERLDQHRRLQQVLASVKDCNFLRQSTIYVDDFLEFTDFERKMLAAIAKAGASIEITLLFDPHSPVLDNPHTQPDDLSPFHRTESAYRQLFFAFEQENIEVNPPIRLEKIRRFASSELARLEREMFPSSKSQILDPKSQISDFRSQILSDLPQSQIANRKSQILLECPDCRTEADAIARGICRLLQQGFRLRQIAVLVRDLSRYHPFLATSFDEHAIPYFVDRRRSAAHHPLLQFLRSILQIARFEWPHEAVMTLLKTGLAGITPDEADELENYVLLHRVRGSRWESDEPWTWRRDLTRPGEEDASSPFAFDPLRIDAVRRSVADKLSPFTKMLRLEKPRPLRAIATELFAVFERFGVRAELSKWMAAAVASPSPGVVSAIEQRDEHEQVWVNVVAIFEQMVELLGDEPVTPESFTQIVDSGIEGFDLALTPPTADQVLVGQVDRTRSPRLRAVFVMGLNEGDFPAVPRDDSVFSDRERREMSRRKLDLEPDARRRLLDERLLGYIAFTQASEFLHLSRPLSDGSNRKLNPSPFWQRVRELFPDVKVVTLPRQHADDIEQISTPRQLVTGLMRWVRSDQNANRDMGVPPMPGASEVETSGKQGSSNDHIARTGGTPVSQDNSKGAWPALYQWFATHSATGDIDVLRQRAWPALRYTNEAALAADLRELLFRAPLSADISQLETFAACPFKHFARYGLRLHAREGEEVGAQDLGRIYHQLLEKLVAQALIARSDAQPDPLQTITGEMIRSAARTAGRALRGEIMLGSARNRYLLSRVERTLEQVLATQREMMKRSRFRPAHTGVAFGEGGRLPALVVTTPRGNEVSLHGKIDRIDTHQDDGKFAVFDYKLSVSPLSLQKVYHGLSMQLLTYLLVLQSGGEALAGRPLTPAAGFYLQLLRFFGDVKHPDEALDPADPRFFLSLKPRGVFHSDALPDLDTDCAEGHSMVVQAYVKKGGSFGYRDTSDVAEAEEFLALLAHVRRRIGEIADQILSGTIDITPSRLNRESPCPQCEFRGVCRFETTVNRYRILPAMKRDDVLVKLKEEAARG